MDKRFNTFLLIAVALASVPLWLSSYREWMASSEWMNAEIIKVVDSSTGLDHRVYITRQPFGATGRRVEVYNSETNALVVGCVGEDRELYESFKKVRQPTMLFRWWMKLEVSCILKPGEYFIKTQWTVRGYSTKLIYNRSNIFQVLPE